MADKPGLLLINIVIVDRFVEKVITIALPHNGFSKKYVQQLEKILDEYDKYLNRMTRGEIQIGTLPIDGIETIGEATASANAIACFMDYRCEESKVSKYDTDGFKQLVDSVTDCVTRFICAPEHVCMDGLKKQVDHLIFTITG